MSKCYFNKVAKHFIDRQLNLDEYLTNSAREYFQKLAFKKKQKMQI